MISKIDNHSQGAHKVSIFMFFMKIHELPLVKGKTHKLTLVTGKYMDFEKTIMSVINNNDIQILDVVAFNNIAGNIHE